MGKLYEIANMKVYPLGNVDEETRFSLIAYLKEVIGKAMYIDDTLDYARIINEWFRSECAATLATVDSETEVRGTLEIVLSTVYKIETTYKDLNSLCDHCLTKIPEDLVCNDYLPVRGLLTRLHNVA